MLHPVDVLIVLAAGPRVPLIGCALLLAGCTSTRLTAFVDDDLPHRPGNGSAGGAPAALCDPCSDFPEAPLLDSENGSVVPPNVGDLFAGQGSETSGVGPCLVEPELGSLFPRNWLRPRFRFIPAAGQSLFELRLHARGARHDLVVYTSATTWTMPAAIWRVITENLADEPITVSIRGLNASQPAPSPSLATTGVVTVSSAEAKGNIVYWSTVFHTDTQMGSSVLKGFAVGDESVREVLRPELTGGPCIACHTATPDGRYLASSVASVISSGDPSHVELHAADGSGAEPDFLSQDARLLLMRERQQFPTFSRAHWQPADRLMVSILNQDLIWTDLEAATQTAGNGWGVLARAGDPNPLVTHPTFNAAGNALAYTSAAAGTLTKADVTDIYLLPFQRGQGGQATPLPGASAQEVNEYYPAFSPDDALIVFNRAPLSVNAPSDPVLSFSSKTTYNNPWGELFVMPATGGSATRIVANDPPACSGKQSPGVANSWGKWAPQAQAAGNRTLYFLTFSSGRVDLARPQLYVAPVAVEPSGQISTYPALYLWNQPPDEGNHTPAWGL